MNRSALMLAFLAVHLTACAAVIPARVRERPPTASQLLHVVSAMDDDLTVPLGLFDISTVTPTEVTAPLVRVLTLDRADLAAMLLMEGDKVSRTCVWAGVIPGRSIFILTLPGISLLYY